MSNNTTSATSSQKKQFKEASEISEIDDSEIPVNQEDIFEKDDTQV